ncbi:hypothetical protein GCM10010112_84940 [Actinoplanes lobatus]|uniref:Uncharacterized protein n=1 Tax=Actinoplanes lobatus TaxID=113568 RepID=A0ABQ4AZ09_9ACTN|nr:hypothetical protein GCM10010112_84940 [Actinoplanes lobatus]GIE46111.1 hypothetical protein Alo02nite_90090 [Actinoplanes lobatus]
MLVSGLAWQDSSSHVHGAMKSRGAPTPADGTTSSTAIGSRGKGGHEHRWIARRWNAFDSGADTAVSIEREVVSGHAYAVLAPLPPTAARCGYDNPTNQSVDGVLTP